MSDELLGDRPNEVFDFKFPLEIARKLDYYREWTLETHLECV